MNRSGSSGGDNDNGSKIAELVKGLVLVSARAQNIAHARG